MKLDENERDGNDAIGMSKTSSAITVILALEQSLAASRDN